MKRLLLVMCGLLMIALFLWDYRAIIVPIYSYTGFIYAWPGLDAMAWAIVLSLAPLVVLPVELHKPSVFLLWWLYVTTYMPSIMMPVITRSLPDSGAMLLQLSVLGSMLLLSSVPYIKTLIVPRLRVPPMTFGWIVVLSWAGCVSASLIYIDFQKVLANFAFFFTGSGSAGTEYYAVRADYMSQLNQTGRLFGYIGRELVTALDPFLIACGLLWKRRWMLVMGIAGQLIYFGQTGMKEVPFAMIAILLLWVLIRRTRKQFGFAFLLAFICALGMFTSFDLATRTASLSTILTRREMAGPGLLTGFYFEHYSKVLHPGHTFTNASGAQLFGPPREIGFYYFGSAETDANANFWAEGFAEYGLPGIFGFGLLVALMLWLFDSIAASHSLELAVLLSVASADALTNSSPLTVLVTHGGILVTLLLYFVPEDGSSVWADTGLSQIWPNWSAKESAHP